MTDEKYLFIPDSKEKKRIARGAYSKLAHAGRGGRVRMPSDYLTRKEREAMSGECKSYRLNEPMTWAEFGEVPDDLKISYINAIRVRFGPSDSEIFRMFGVDQRKGAYKFKQLNLGRGRGATPLKFHAEAWHKWRNGIKYETVPESDDNIFNARCIMANEESSETELKNTEQSEEKVVEETFSVVRPVIALHPNMGEIRLCGTIREIAETLVAICGEGIAHVNISWRLGE